MEIPIKSKNRFPKIAKNVISEDVKMKRKTDKNKIFFSEILAENDENIGMSVIGSIATNVLKKF